jgi:hypothetical protein
MTLPDRKSARAARIKRLRIAYRLHQMYVFGRMDEEEIPIEEVGQ